MTMPQAEMAPAAAAPAPSFAPAQSVALTDLNVPFMRLVAFFFKAFFAAIPAVIASLLVIRIVFGLIFWTFGGWRYGMGGWL